MKCFYCDAEMTFNDRGWYDCQVPDILNATHLVRIYEHGSHISFVNNFEFFSISNMTDLSPPNFKLNSTPDVIVNQPLTKELVDRILKLKAFL